MGEKADLREQIRATRVYLGELIAERQRQSCMTVMIPLDLVIRDLQQLDRCLTVGNQQSEDPA